MRAEHSTVESEEQADSLFGRAGSALVEFNAAATRKESAAINELIQAWHELDRAQRECRASAEPDVVVVQRPTAVVTRQFMRCRFLVRTSNAFRQLSAEARNAIASSLFEMPRTDQ